VGHPPTHDACPKENIHTTYTQDKKEHKCNVAATRRERGERRYGGKFSFFVVVFLNLLQNNKKKMEHQSTLCFVRRADKERE
jgi:hypothetical protein